MSAFGDDEPADAYDPTARVEAEPLARRLHEERRTRAGGGGFDDLDPAERALAIAVAVAVLAWLRREGALR